MPFGRPRIYPWDLWLDGQRHLLLAGQDFREDVVLRSFRNQIYVEGRRRGQRVSVERYGDGGIVIQAGPRPANPKAAKAHERYDWPALFDGKVHELHSGADFPRGSVENFRRTVRAAAARYNVRVRTKLLNHGTLMVMSYAAVERPDAVAPPIIFDSGVDEDSVFDVPSWGDGGSGEQDRGLADAAAG